MWGCNCKFKLKNGTHRIKFHKTDVDEYNICKNCGYYAVWLSPEDIFKNTGKLSITVINRKTLELSYFKNTNDVKRYTGVSVANITSSKAFRSGKIYTPKNCNFSMLKGYHRTVKKEVLDKIKLKEIFVFKNTGKLLGSAEKIKDVAKIGGDSYYSVRSNLERETVKTKNNNIYTYNKNINIKEYLEIDLNYEN